LSDSFTVDVGTPSVLRFALNGQDSGLFNVDLYVKAGSGASPTSYDCKADGLSVFGSCEFLQPTPGTWSIFVSDASGAGLYQVATTIFAGAAPIPTPTPTTTDTPVPATLTPTQTATATLTATPTLKKMPKPTNTPKPTRTPKK
jgi:hypothetical protein